MPPVAGEDRPAAAPADDRQTALLVRNIADGDVEAVVDLWERAGLTRPWNDPRRDIAFARRDDHATVLVAAVGTAIVATAMVGEDGHRGWVYYVTSDPARRGEGLGRRIMAAAEEWLLARGVWKMHLLVRAENTAAVSFYEHLGFSDGRVSCLQKVIRPDLVPARPEAG